MGDDEAFRNACRFGDLEEAKRLFTLERAHMMDSDGRQAMNAAVLYGALEVAKWLHEEKGIRLDHAIHSGETLMHDACERGNLEIVRWLSSRGVPLDAPDNKGRHPKHRAIFMGHVHVLEYFRERGVPFGPDLERVFRDALMHGRLPTVEWLQMHAGISVGAVDPRTGAMPGAGNQSFGPLRFDALSKTPPRRRAPRGGRENCPVHEGAEPLVARPGYSSGVSG